MVSIKGLTETIIFLSIFLSSTSLCIGQYGLENLIELSLTPSEDVFAEGENVVLTAELKNRSAFKLFTTAPRYRASRAFPEELPVENDGRKIEVELDGKTLDHLYNPPTQPAINSKYPKIYPSGRFGYVYRLNELFRLTVGKYRVRTWRQVALIPHAAERPKELKIYSDWVYFEITGKPVNRSKENRLLIEDLINEDLRKSDPGKLASTINRLGRRGVRDATPHLINLLDFDYTLVRWTEKDPQNGTFRKLSKKRCPRSKNRNKKRPLQICNLQLTKAEWVQIRQERIFEKYFVPHYPAVFAVAWIGKPGLKPLLQFIRNNDKDSLAVRNAMSALNLIFYRDSAGYKEFLDSNGLNGLRANWHGRFYYR